MKDKEVDDAFARMAESARKKQEEEGKKINPRIERIANIIGRLLASAVATLVLASGAWAIALAVNDITGTEYLTRDYWPYALFVVGIEVVRTFWNLPEN